MSETIEDVHRHPIYRRWSDLDSLNHVNNVRYVEWAREGLLAARREGIVPPGALSPSRFTVAYRRPVVLGEAPVWVETAPSATGFVQRIVERAGDDELVCAEIETTMLEPGDALTPRDDPGHIHPLHLRAGDVGPDGRADYPRLVECFQDSRLAAFDEILGPSWLGTLVLGSIEIRVAEPLEFASSPYRVHSWVESMGRASMVVMGQILGAGRVAAEARAVMVGFDLAGQRSRPWTEAEREAYGRLAPRS